MLVMRFNPWEGSTFIYHLVAASIPKDRLRTEECHPREILGSYDTESLAAATATGVFKHQARSDG